MTFRPLVAGISLFVLHSVFAPVSDADHAPVLLPNGMVVHGDWGLHRPGHMPLRFQYYDASPNFDYFYASPPVVFYGRRYGAHVPVSKDETLDPKDYAPRTGGFYPRGTGSYFPTNKEDPAAYTPRENENGPTRSPERFYREWGAASEFCNNCGKDGKDLSDPTIYPKWDMPDNVYVPAPSVPVVPPKNP